MNSKELYDQIHTQVVSDKESYLHKKTLPQEILDYLELEVPLDSRILELGTGGGHLAHWLQVKGYDVLATDISQVALDVAKSNYPDLRIQLIDAQDMQLEDNSFNVVIAIELIKHLPRLHEHIREVRRVLRTDAVYIVKTPNKWLNKLFDRIQPRRCVRPGHVSLCSIGDLRQMLTEDGLTCRFLKQKSLTQTQITKLRLLVPQVVTRIAISCLNFFLILAPLLFMPSIICIARKKCANID